MSLKFRAETRFQAVEPGVHGRFQAGELGFQAGKASADETHSQNSRYDAHDNGEHRHKDRELEPNVDHAVALLYRLNVPH
jgi:hypothetical protein